MLVLSTSWIACAAVAATGFSDGAAAPSASTGLIAASAMDFHFDAAALAALPSSAAQDAQPREALPSVGRNAFGVAESWRWQIHAGYGDDLNDDSLAMGGVAFSYFLEDELSLDFEFNLIHFQQDKGEDAFGFNFNLLFRWHFFRDESNTFSIYADGGAGAMGSDEKVPSDGSSFNFMPQIGVGVSIDVGGDTRLLTGVRWHHVSNGNVFESNPGRDSLLVYAGLNFPF